MNQSDLQLLPDEATMFKAFVSRDASFEGIFLTGVRTTGIFCRPTCPARKPKQENVEFFPRAGDALAAGFRPCKRCTPLEALGMGGGLPDWLKPLMDAVDRDPLRRWTAEDLRSSGIDPARARRWFQASYGMTFVAYLRSRRLGQAFSRIQEGSDIIEASMDADFDSVSGFCDAIRRKTGVSPSKAIEKKRLTVTQVASPLGPIMVAGDDEAIYLIEFWDRRMLETQFDSLEKRIGAVFFPGTTSVTDRMSGEIAEYFQGTRTEFHTPIRFPGSPHQEAVWQALLNVPPGKTWTYGGLAEAVRKPTAVRSVARAVGENRLSIVVPCHRIIGANGQLTGYGGGLWRKRFLLALEQGEKQS
ncbi:MAG: AraC family transcriptional regulator of adaptative response [Verrucomicrobiales bacterium]|jgi:AraC family transcriptional regulator of adaptative response/methylated-DNA-[protein]-cysteine methyltransferase